MHMEQAFGLILFGFVVGVCFTASVGFALMFRAGQRVTRARAARKLPHLTEAEQAALRG